MTSLCDELDVDYKLSADTLNILQQFLAEKEAASEELPAEDWQLSQFWYSEETISRLVDEIINAVGPDGGRIACISCPSMVPSLLQKLDGNEKINVTLFEYDQRFATRFLTTFVHYDYREPLALPASMEHFFDVIVADPPFISEECLVKTAQSIRLLAKPDAKLLLCTGAILEDLAFRLLKVRPTGFQPTHANNLANEFYAYSNYKTLTL